MAIEPAVCGSRPATMRISVDLPQPEGPSNVRNSPSSTSSDKLRRTRVVCPAGSTKSLLICRTEMCAMRCLELLREAEVEDAALDVGDRQRVVPRPVDIRHSATEQLAGRGVADQRWRLGV